MAWDSARKFFSTICSGDDREAFSRRDMLAGLGLAGLIVAVPKILGPATAEAKDLSVADQPPAPAKAKGAEERREAKDADTPDATDLSSRHHRRRRYWRRRYWRHRYWRRRHWRRRYWRRRYWRRRW
jgi:hypothetical protein